jgi:hypothetical protein
MNTTILLSILLLPTILLGQVINHFDNLDSKWNVAKTYPAANQQNPNFVATNGKKTLSVKLIIKTRNICMF